MHEVTISADHLLTLNRVFLRTALFLAYSDQSKIAFALLPCLTSVLLSVTHMGNFMCFKTSCALSSLH